MSHMIDASNSRSNIAYIGEEPWHGLGQALQPGESIKSWAQAAGLSHTVMSTPVKFTPFQGETTEFPARSVLYRSDTNAPLSVVSKNYKVVQPSDVLAFFDKLTKHNGFQMETAGSLDGGKRIWALARVNEGAPVIGQDVVRPYVLLATSYDGTMATTAKLTTVRVVCHNTLTMSVGYGRQEASETDTENGTVRVLHSKVFNIDSTMLDLGIAFTAFDKFMIETRRLAKRQVNEAFATAFLKKLLPAQVKTTIVKGEKVVTPSNVEDSKAFQQIMGLFRGEAIGSDLMEARGSAWGLLNAVTQHVDHQRGRTPSTRLSSAWFGSGEALKNNARDLLLEVIS